MSVITIIALVVSLFSLILNFHLWRFVSKNDRILSTHRKVLRALLKAAPELVHDEVRKLNEIK